MQVELKTSCWEIIGKFPEKNKNLQGKKTLLGVCLRLCKAKGLSVTMEPLFLRLDLRKYCTLVPVSNCSQSAVPGV